MESWSPMVSIAVPDLPVGSATTKNQALDAKEPFDNFSIRPNPLQDKGTGSKSIEHGGVNLNSALSDKSTIFEPRKGEGYDILRLRSPSID